MIGIIRSKWDKSVAKGKKLLKKTLIVCFSKKIPLTEKLQQKRFRRKKVKGTIKNIFILKRTF